MGSELLVAVVLAVCTIADAVSKNDYFTAAVFEHRPREKKGQNKIEAASSNLGFYEKAAEIAASKGADIILFNEYGLFLYHVERELLRNYMEQLPDPAKVKFNPCGERRDDFFIASSLSCLAKKNNIYVVAHMGEIQPCEDVCDKENIASCRKKCSEDGFLIYNTAVVFDRDGNLVAKYHKMHPYLENVNTPEDPEFATFKTDFGTFGLVICFDSVFEESVILARDYGINTVLFPTFWFEDALPFNGVEWQQSWAIANKVNFVAANTQTPGNGSLGSGIYTKDNGALVYTYEPDGKSKLLVANIPLRKINDFSPNPSITVINEQSVYIKLETGDLFPEQGYNEVAGPTKDHYLDYRYFKHQTENYTLVKLNAKRGQHVEACYNGFCCSLSYEAQSMEEDYYLAAYSGLNNVRNFYFWCEETCLLLRCDPFGGKSCVMQPSRSNTVFNSLEITAEFTTDKIYPTVSKSKFRLAPKSEWKIKNRGSKTTLKFESDENEPLLKAGLISRCYERDPPFIPYFKN